MFVDTDERIIGVNGLSNDVLIAIRAYLQGAVYCWCNTKGEIPFAARDFLGGENFFWEGTPMYELYGRYIRAGKSKEYAFEQAAKDAGKILKSVLHDDKRYFKSTDGYRKSYAWEPQRTP